MGLRQSDLEFTVDPVFEIDSYKSKMGDDEDIVVLSFSVNGEQPAKDLVNFCLLYTSPSPRDSSPSRMPSSA